MAATPASLALSRPNHHSTHNMERHITTSESQMEHQQVSEKKNAGQNKS
jgi:hypothetical protein